MPGCRIANWLNVRATGKAAGKAGEKNGFARPGKEPNNLRVLGLEIEGLPHQKANYAMA